MQLFRSEKREGNRCTVQTGDPGPYEERPDYASMKESFSGVKVQGRRPQRSLHVYPDPYSSEFVEVIIAEMRHVAELSVRWGTHAIADSNDTITSRW